MIIFCIFVFSLYLCARFRNYKNDYLVRESIGNSTVEFLFLSILAKQRYTWSSGFVWIFLTNENEVSFKGTK